MPDPQIQAAQRARVPYLEPEGIGDPVGRRARRPATVPLAESYATQEHVSVRGGVRLLVRASLDETVPTPTDFYLPAKWLVTAWNPWGDPSTPAENRVRTERLLAELRAAGALVSDVLATSPPDRSWVEDTVVALGLPADDVLRMARTAGQPAVTAWRDRFLTVVPTGLVDGLEEVTRPAVVEARDRTCPMRVDDVAGDRCVMRGGPWTSGSIHAAAIWAAHRRLLLARLGCDSCDDGARPTLGPLGSMRGPVELAEPVLASRYGGYAWR